jgi:hypothetical protein
VTVRQLIERLKQLPQDATVFLPRDAENDEASPLDEVFVEGEDVLLGP